MISVLVVDDEIDILKIEKMFLELSGDLSVQTSISAYNAIELMKNEIFDVIVSDYNMPGMDGLELLKYIRKRSNIPFIIFTGKGREEIVIEAINSGVDFYIQKGGEPKACFAELEHKIKRAVNKIPIDTKSDFVTDSKDFFNAISCINRAIENNADIQKTLNKELINLIEEGKIIEAIQYCDRELFKNSKLSELWLVKAFLIGIGKRNFADYSHDVFISYSIEDKDIANQICYSLEDDGIKCWMAPRNISPTKIWSEAIPQAIQETKIILLILSKSSNVSDNVLREIIVGCNFGKKIVPVRIEEIELSHRLKFLLQIWQIIDIYQGNLSENTYGLIKQLKMIIK